MINFTSRSIHIKTQISMKKLATILMLVVAVFVGGMTIDAKKTKTKSRAKMSQTSRKTSNSLVSSNGSDLAFFNVYGKVKSITYPGGVLYPTPLGGFIKPIKFNEKGDCININEIVNSQFESSYRKVKISRNNQGEISKITFDDPKDGPDHYYGIYKFKWNGGRVTGYEEDIPYAGGETYITYDNGNVETIITLMATQGGDYRYVYKFSNFKIDDNGNWKECDLNWKEEHEGKLINSNTQHIKRIIEYYP